MKLASMWRRTRRKRAKRAPAVSLPRRGSARTGKDSDTLHFTDVFRLTMPLNAEYPLEKGDEASTGKTTPKTTLSG